MAALWSWDQGLGCLDPVFDLKVLQLVLGQRSRSRPWLDAMTRLENKHIAVFKSRLCTAWRRAVFTYLQSWLQCGCLLILIRQWLMFINLYPCWLNECSAVSSKQRQVLVCTADVSASQLVGLENDSILQQAWRVCFVTNVGFCQSFLQWILQFHDYYFTRESSCEVWWWVHLCVSVH